MKNKVKLVENCFTFRPKIKYCLLTEVAIEQGKITKKKLSHLDQK